MKPLFVLIISGWLGLSACSCLGSNLLHDSLGFQSISDEMFLELSSIKKEYESNFLHLEKQLQQTTKQLYEGTALSTEEQLNLLLEKSRLQDELNKQSILYDIDLNSTRYNKGMELIKIMYEKILDLDHHFVSLQTYQSILRMSNPNAYPEFQQSMHNIRRRLKRKNAIQLPKFLMNNPYLSATYSLVASFIGDGNSNSKEEDLHKIACIMDFTVRMNADLNIIYYETEYLKEGNQLLKEECQSLFENYTRIIGYRVPLDRCRNTDDWEKLQELLDAYMRRLEKQVSNPSEMHLQKVKKGTINLEFSIDRLLDFLNKYTAFIEQGGKYYQKFQIVISNYQNEVICAKQLPHQFSVLKQNINFSIEKFNKAYNVNELKGSKLKDLLYGFND